MIRPEEPLHQRVSALPRELHPTRDLWPGIEQRLRTSERRWRALAATVLIGLATAVLAWRLAGDPAHRRAVPILALGAPPPVARPESAKGQSFAAASALMQRSYRERLALLAPATRRRVEADLAMIQAARGDLEAALADDPASPVLLQLQRSTLLQEIALYRAVTVNTDPLISKTRSGT